MFEYDEKAGEYDLKLYGETGILWDSSLCQPGDVMEIETIEDCITCELCHIEKGGVFEYENDYYIKDDDYHVFNLMENSYINFTDPHIYVKPVKATLVIEK